MNAKKIKTFEDACNELGLDPEKVIPDFSCYPEPDQKAMIAHAKLIIITKAANKLENNNEEWIPDYTNIDQYKYEPWFIMDEGSSGFRCGDYGHWGTHAFVGSRLCFKTREECEYIAEQFIDLYRDYLMK